VLPGQSVNADAQCLCRRLFPHCLLDLLLHSGACCLQLPLRRPLPRNIGPIYLQDLLRYVVREELEPIESDGAGAKLLLAAAAAAFAAERLFAAAVVAVRRLFAVSAIKGEAY
jgi:hypothetical protein